jgi:hypothetical protein
MLPLQAVEQVEIIPDKLKMANKKLNNLRINSITNMQNFSDEIFVSMN